MPLKLLRKFIQLETSSGYLLFAATFIALLLANSPWQVFYHLAWSKPLTLTWDHITLSFNLTTAINEGLMAIFFLLVSLEIKRELCEGELNSVKKATLPIFAAAGGMLAPAIIYILFNGVTAATTRGWAIPTATDIAFSLGVLALLKKQIPLSLKVFLTALAILDDLGAILIIVLFYSHSLAWQFLIASFVCVALLCLLNRLNVTKIWPYLTIGILLWFFVLKSGVHATIAGVLTGLIIPLKVKKNPAASPLRLLENKLHPWVAFLILPLFALANAGVHFSGMQLSNLVTPLTLGIGLGLFVGKQLGIMSTTWLAIRLGLSKLPTNASWQHFYGIALLCGIGFTMSLFLGNLAFTENNFYLEQVKIGVLAGSLLSAVCGYAVLKLGATVPLDRHPPRKRRIHLEN